MVIKWLGHYWASAWKGPYLVNMKVYEMVVKWVLWWVVVWMEHC
jgi:hypothetical protein